MNIQRTIGKFYATAAKEHHRYRSWEYCYQYFRNARVNSLTAARDHAALQLGFYLASWGMYRGSSFLLQHTYTVHRNVIDVIAESRFDDLWNADFGEKKTDVLFIPRVWELIAAVREAYKPFAPRIGSAQPTDTLVTKVILGTFGCLPACDRYFIDGFKQQRFSYSRLNNKFMDQILGFCQKHHGELEYERARIKKAGGIHYPLMKLVDMHFWQIGYQLDTAV
jgi:hypothetical protein